MGVVGEGVGAGGIQFRIRDGYYVMSGLPGDRESQNKGAFKQKTTNNLVFNVYTCFLKMKCVESSFSSSYFKYSTKILDTISFLTNLSN